MTYDLLGNETVHYIETLLSVPLFAVALLSLVALARTKSILQKLGVIALSLLLVGAGGLCISVGSNGAEEAREAAAAEISDHYGVNIDADIIRSYGKFAFGENGRPDDIYDFTAPSPGDATELKSYGLHYDRKNTTVRLYERTDTGYTELSGK